MSLRYHAAMRPELPAHFDTAVIDLSLAEELYSRYAKDLSVARDEQRALKTNQEGMKTQLDDVEAELTYLFIRHFQPQHIVEIGSLHGWSTTWNLRALRDNGSGRLTTMDLIDNAKKNVPDELSEGRWEFRQGDVREASTDWISDVEYLFIDAAHGAKFGRWYLANLFPKLPIDLPISVHDVFHSSFPWPFSEGLEVVRWLGERDITYFTAASKREKENYRRLLEVKNELGLTEPVHTGRDNPMIYFRLK